MHIHKTAESDCQHLHVCLSAWNNYVLTEQIFVKFDMYFSKIYRENSSLCKILQEW
jgi:hypothetical protein